METRLVHETETEVEALALQEMLEREGIACVLVNHRDTAYPGIVDRARSATEIRVSAEHAEQAGRLIAEFRAAEPVEGPPSTAIPENETPIRGPGALLSISILFGLLALAVYLLAPR